MIFKEIKGHQGPLRKTHPEYKGSAYNVLVQWEDGSETYEPLDEMIKDDPVSIASYAVENNLLDTPGWKRVRHIAKNQKKLDLLPFFCRNVISAEKQKISSERVYSAESLIE